MFRVWHVSQERGGLPRVVPGTRVRCWAGHITVHLHYANKYPFSSRYVYFKSSRTTLVRATLACAASLCQYTAAGYMAGHITTGLVLADTNPRMHELAGAGRA